MTRLEEYDNLRVLNAPSSTEDAARQTDLYTDENARDALAAALAATGAASVTVDDAGDTITIGATQLDPSSLEDGGSNELSVAGLSGDLADPQDPTSHGNTAHSTNYAAESHGHPTSDLDQSGASSGDVLEWDGTAWGPAVDDTGSGSAFNRFEQNIDSGSGTEYQKVATVSSGDSNEQGFVSAELLFAADRGAGADRTVSLVASIWRGDLLARSTEAGSNETDQVDFVLTQTSGTGNGGYDELHLYVRADDYAAAKAIVEYGPLFGGRDTQTGLAAADLTGSVVHDTETDAQAAGSGGGVFTEELADSTQLSSGVATVATGITDRTKAINVSLAPGGSLDGSTTNSSEVKVVYRDYWDESNSTPQYTLEIIEDGTNVGNPTVGYRVFSS